MSERPFLDFYEKNKIIPVHQSINKIHFQRRKYLYQTLGLLNIQKKDSIFSVAEVGPGTGDNAAITSSLIKGKYTFIDGNSTSINSIKSKIKDGSLPADSEIIDVDFNKIDISKSSVFDIVICEGTVVGQESPKDFANKLFQISNGGIVVLTCADAFSLLPELLRRLYSPIIRQDNFDESVNKGIDAFESTLLKLKSMSRNKFDWVADVILNPWMHSNWQFSINHAVEVAKNNKISAV